MGASEDGWLDFCWYCGVRWWRGCGRTGGGGDGDSFFIWHGESEKVAEPGGEDGGAGDAQGFLAEGAGLPASLREFDVVVGFFRLRRLASGAVREVLRLTDRLLAGAAVEQGMTGGWPSPWGVVRWSGCGCECGGRRTRPSKVPAPCRCDTALFAALEHSLPGAVGWRLGNIFRRDSLRGGRVHASGGSDFMTGRAMTTPAWRRKRRRGHLLYCWAAFGDGFFHSRIWPSASRRARNCG